MGPRAGLDGRKISSLPEFDPGPSSPWSVAIPTELPDPHSLFCNHLKSRRKTVWATNKDDNENIIEQCNTKERRIKPATSQLVAQRANKNYCVVRSSFRIFRSTDCIARSTKANELCAETVTKFICVQ